MVGLLTKTGEGAMDSYTVVFELRSAEDAAHAAAVLDHHGDIHSTFTATTANSAELVLTLPAEDLRQAILIALDLLRAAGRREIRRVEAQTSDDYDRRARPRRT
jgi:hypothetical protein